MTIKHVWDHLPSVKINNNMALGCERCRFSGCYSPSQLSSAFLFIITKFNMLDFVSCVIMILTARDNDTKGGKTTGVPLLCF